MLALLLALNLVPPPAADPQVGNAQLLWQQPQPRNASDWFWGPGGKQRAPVPPFQFVRENLGGTNPKIDVRDARGALWVVKFGGEVHGDTFAARLLYALGYFATPTYYVPAGVISGLHGLKRAKEFVGKDGSFQRARFKLVDDQTAAYADEFHWSWVDNPFLGSHALGGLKILVMLASNWDTKDARDGEGSNTAVFLSAPDKAYWYSFNDWGATLGNWGGFFTRSKWDSSAYERQTRNFVKLGPDGKLIWGYSGKHGRDIVEGITVSDIRWLLPDLSRIDVAELEAGLIASGATPETAARLARSMQNRIAQLASVAGIRSAEKN